MQAEPAGGAAAPAATNAAAQPAEPTAAAAAAASDAHKGVVSGGNAAASTAAARPSSRLAGRNAPTKSKSLEIPRGRTTANQRMTRAAAARAAAELADTAPGSESWSVMEEDEEEDEDMDEEGHAMQLQMVSHLIVFLVLSGGIFPATWLKGRMASIINDGVYCLSSARHNPTGLAKVTCRQAAALVGLLACRSHIL